MFKLSLLSTAAFAVLATGAAFAQTSDSADDGALVQEAITVTAQFREQSVLDVPIAITAYTGEFLKDIGVDEFDELSAFTPGFVVQEQSVNNPGFVLRGITSDSGASNIEPRVSVFQNGVSIARSRGSIVQLFDIERVEVLKGPQGTLFGRSAQIGAVHVITNKAKLDTFEGGINGGYGNFDAIEAGGYINIPLIEDKLAVRGAISFDQRDGFIDNTEGGDALQGTDTVAGRLSLRVEPISTLGFDLIAGYSKDTPPGTSFKSGVIPALGGSTDPNEDASLNTFGNFLGGTELGVERELFDITGISIWEISPVLTNVTTAAYREFDSLEVFDPDGTAFDLFIFAEDAEGEQFSIDTRFNYDPGGRFRGFFGGGWFTEEGSQSVPLGLGLGNVGAFFTGIPVQGAPVNGAAPFFGNIDVANLFLTGDPANLALAGVPQGLFQLETFTNFSETSSWDLFAEAEFDITDRLTFTAGGRYTRDDKETLFSSTLNQPAFPGSTAILVGESGGIISSDDQAGLDNTFSGFSWRAVLKYQVSDNLNTYFNYSRGRRPEVIQDEFDATAGGAGITGQFDIIPEETVDSFEVGAKASLFEGRLTTDAAVYYYQYDNFQTTVVQDGGIGQAPTFVTVNGGTADSFGVELGLFADASEWLDIFATYGYNRGRFNETDDNGDPQQFGGNQFRLSPDHSFSIGATATAETGYGNLFFTPTYTWQSKVFFQDANEEAFNVVDPVSSAILFSVPSVSQEAFGLLNLRTGVRLMEDKVELSFYVENLLDKEFIVDGGNTGGAFGIPTFIAGKPRFFGGAISYTF